MHIVVPENGVLGKYQEVSSAMYNQIFVKGGSKEASVH
jgi:hypothetical protein